MSADGGSAAHVAVPIDDTRHVADNALLDGALRSALANPASPLARALHARSGELQAAVDALVRLSHWC